MQAPDRTQEQHCEVNAAERQRQVVIAVPEVGCMGVEQTLVARLEQMWAVQAVTAEISRELELPTLLGLIVRRAVELLGESFQ